MTRHIGLITLFSALCTFIIITMSMTSLYAANNEKELVNMSIQSNEAYYKADKSATKILKDILNGEAPSGVTFGPEDMQGNQIIEYSVKINDNQSLSVRLRLNDKNYRILNWNTVFDGEWTPNDGVEVWEGTD